MLKHTRVCALCALQYDGYDNLHRLGEGLKGRVRVQFIDEHGEPEAGVVSHWCHFLEILWFCITDSTLQDGHMHFINEHGEPEAGVVSHSCQFCIGFAIVTECC